MSEIEYHPEARLEVIEAGQWYSEIDEQVGEQFKIELARSECQVQRNPETWGRLLARHPSVSLQEIPVRPCLYPTW